jgi:dihydroxyacid dehydratase/phosphogluconate dehydratase
MRASAAAGSVTAPPGASAVAGAVMASLRAGLVAALVVVGGSVLSGKEPDQKKDLIDSRKACRRPF